MKVKARGTFYDKDWHIEQGEVKELPENWKQRPSVIAELKSKNPLFKVVDETEAQKAITDFKLPIVDAKNERQPINFTRGKYKQEMIDKEIANKKIDFGTQPEEEDSVLVGV